ncbi:glycosyl transferase [Kibdelosporangium philippinense]|uniref:Glycosyl transferase n=1 Tax=Kibdelosporangium philippinense TaxID=211113 RepID=A0ABS8ZQZ1_9PSEU|nr:glycosyl transferase [Kibdelosporangium philippinense]MCE7009026.1 glycosyl transferase [Kibdelosporangium philippinense]
MIRHVTTRVTARDLIVIGIYVLASVLLYSLMWTDLRNGYLYNSMQDQNMFEWFFALAAAAPGDAFFTTLQNYPTGVNMMANTSVLGLGIPLAPITWLFGSTVTWTVALTGSVAANAAGWYWVISRHMVDSRTAAAIGGAFCAFAPPMVTHATAHPNFTALFLVPFIVSRLIHLARGEKLVKHGVILGLLVAYQVFLGEEPLLITATALLIFGLAWPSVLSKHLLKGIGIGAAVTLVLVAYPLWQQFVGPQSYDGLGHGPAGNDLASITAFGSYSIAGDPESAGKVAINPTEENAFLGWPLVIFLVVLAIWLWRVAAARALVITTVAMAVLSLGWELKINGENTGFPLPWQLVSELPLYDSMLGPRLFMACVPLIGILLAMACYRILTLAQHATHIPLRLLWFGALAAILIPLAPTPLPIISRADTPAYFTEGMWRANAGPDKSVVTVPLAGPGNSLPLYWQAQAGMGFNMAEGYFVGPDREELGHYGAVQRPTSRLLDEVAQGYDRTIGPAEIAQARIDLRYWRAGVVVLGPHERQRELRAVCELLFGHGTYVGGVWTWVV